MKVIDYKEAKDKHKPEKLVQITSLQTLADLAYVKECIERETGLDPSYRQIINYLIKFYLRISENERHQPY